MASFRPIVFALLTGVAATWLADRAEAQYVPYARYGNYGFGPYVSPSSAYVDRGAVAAQKGADRRQQLDQTFQQHTATNRYLLEQAQQNSAWIAQNQATVDQFRLQQVQTQSQQFAAAQTARAQPPAGSLPLVTLYEAQKKAASPEGAKQGAVRWPTLLMDPRFDEPRAKLDKLLEAWKSSKVGLTSGEYEEMAALARQMKDILRGMAAQLNAAEYLTVQDLLDDVIAKAQAAANPNK